MRKLLALLCLLPGLAHGAITYIGAGSASNAIDGGAVTPSVHASTTTGDLIVCAVAQKNATDYTILTSTGYTMLYGRNRSGGNTLAIIGKIATGSDTVSVDSSDNTVGRTVISQCATFRGTLGTVTGIVDGSAGTDNAAQTNIDTPALTVTAANSVVLIVGMRANQFAAEDIAVLSGMDAEIGQPERTSSATVGMIWDYDIQTTASSKSASAFVTTTNTATAVAVALNLKEAVTAPTWSVSPTVSAQDADSYTLSYTASTSATFYAVACKKDQTAPTIAQVKAGNCTGDAAAIASANEAVTGADTTVLGGSLTRPVHDLYAVLSNGGGDSTLATLADECLDAATGKTFVGGCPGGLTSIHANSPFALFNAQATPDVAVGDIPICDSALTPNSALTLTWTAAGLFSYPGGDPSKQSYTCTFYDLSAGAMHADTWTGYVNNVAPVALFAAYETALVKDAAMASVDFATQFYDPDDATLTYTSSDTGTGTGANTRPAGTSQTTGVWSGTPTSTDGSIGSWTETATDEAGDAASMPVQWGVYAQVAVPDCAGLDVASCAALGAAVHLEVMATYDCSNSVAANYVVSQSPAATTVVDPFTALAVAASSGACSGISAWTTTFLADGVSVPSTAVYVDGAAFTHSGGRYVAPLPASARTVFLRGLQYRQDGALIINTTDAITHYVRGIGLTAQGEVKAATCSPDYVVAGVPMDPDGTVCMTDIN